MPQGRWNLAINILVPRLIFMRQCAKSRVQLSFLMSPCQCLVTSGRIVLVLSSRPCGWRSPSATGSFCACARPRPVAIHCQLKCASSFNEKKTLHALPARMWTVQHALGTAPCSRCLLNEHCTPTMICGKLINNDLPWPLRNLHS